jgi:hypothetical protein
VTEPSAPPPGRWRYGLHPHATGLQVRSLGRVDLPLGEALRLEMAGADPDSDQVVHVQYFISTEVGPWALWLSCARSDLAAEEALLGEITVSFEESPDPPPPALHDRPPLARWED